MFASGNLDGLEWSLYNSTGQGEFKQNSGLQQRLADMQNRLAILPNYNFKTGIKAQEQAGTSVSGVVGAVIILLLAVFVGIIIKTFSRKK